MNLSAIAKATATERTEFELPAPGVYKGYIESAEVKVGKTSGNKYIGLRISLKDADDKSYGSIFPNFFVNDKNYCMYQLKQLLEAVDFPMEEGEVSEEEVASMVEKREVFVAVTIEAGKDGYKDKAVIDWNGFDPAIAVIDKFYEVQAAATGDDDPWAHINDGEDELPFPVR